MTGSDRWGAPDGYPGRGAPKLITAPAPAAGADFTLTPPVGVRWRILGGQAQLKTSAAVANRQVLLEVTRGGVVVFTCPSPSVQAAGLTYAYQLLPGVTQPTLVSTYPVLPFPVAVVLDETWRLASSTAAIDVADQWSAIALLVEELGPTP